MEANQAIEIRRYKEADFPEINRLNTAEGWKNLVEKEEDTRAAWANSNAAFIVEVDGEIIGCLRGLTDGSITLYIAELLIDEKWRGQGIGSRLLTHAHEVYPKTRMELLASTSSRTYYETQRYRPFFGFRKTKSE